MRRAQRWPWMVMMSLIFGAALMTGDSLAGATEGDDAAAGNSTKAKTSTNADGQRDGDYVEYYDSGKFKIRAKYVQGQLDGPYFEFYESGKIKTRSNYKSGKLNGKHQVMTDRGQPELNAFYIDGKLEGMLVHFENGKAVRTEIFKNGEPVSGRTLPEIKKTLAIILAKPKNDQDAALRQLVAYRYICGVPYENLAIDAVYTKEAQAAAQVLEKLGKLDHNPPDPGGLPAGVYELGRKGAGHSNLASGNKNLVEAVDGWMNDSDKSNIDRLGHRRWCINPGMLKTGFGASGKFFTLYAFDHSQPKQTDFDFIAYPARGIMPVEFFHASSAWSVTLNPEKFSRPDTKIQPKIFQVDDRYEKTGSALPLNYSNVELSGFGIDNCIIFRPDKAAIAAGSTFLVQIDGLFAKDGVTPAPLHYFVQLVSLNK